MHRLAVNETSPAIAVDPRHRWGASGIEIVPGGHYRLQARGRVQGRWFSCGPEGWPGWLLEGWNRLPWRRLCLLCGTVGQNLQRAFPIGRGCDWFVPAEAADWPDRQLYLFANDRRERRGQPPRPAPRHGGLLTVTVTRLA